MSYTQAELVSTANTQNYDFANDYKDVELQKGKVIVHKDFEVQDTRNESLEPVRDRSVVTSIPLIQHHSSIM